MGWPTVFIRLTGCPLRCQYCDTSYAFFGGQTLSVEQISQQVKAYQPLYVCVTGGEPLMQKNCYLLLKRLCDSGYRVSLETSGAMDISKVDDRVSRVVDIKTPGSNECTRNRWDNINHLTAHDQIKFVICSPDDYQWAIAIVEQYHLEQHCEVLFSPSADQLSPSTLANWIVTDRLPVRFQIQLHKILWPGESGR